MANVFFKKGTQANLEKLISEVKANSKQFTAGSFYLTEDSDRLYFAQSATELVHLNHNVIQVDSFSNLPTITTAIVGDFYYCVSENVLCTKQKASDTQWTQINKNTNDDTYVTGVVMKAEADKDNNALKFNTTIKQSKKNVSGGIAQQADVEAGEITISQADLDAVLDLDPDLVASVNGGKATIKASHRDVANGDGFTIVGDGSVVSVSADGNGIKITGKDTTYKFGKSGSNLTLTNVNTSGASGSVALNSGTDITVDASGTSAFTFNHKEVKRTDVTETAQTPSHGNALTVVTGVDTSSTGHVEAVHTTKYTLPADKYATQVTADTEGNIKITRSDGQSITSTGGVLYYTVNGTKVTNGGAIDFYTKAEIDALKIEANAMVYRGLINSTSQSTIIGASGTTTKLSIGDTYKVDTAGTVCGHDCKVGDLLIANGTEDTATGKITATSLTWDYIPAGNDVYNLTVASGGQIKLTSDTANAGIATIAGDKTSGDKASDEIIVTTDATNKKISIAHAKHDTVNTPVNAPSALTHSGTFDVITELTAVNGHIEGYKTTKFTLPADNNSKYTLDAKGSDDAVELTLNGTAGGATTSVKLNAGDHIGIDKTDANNVTIKHKPVTVTKATDATSTLSHGGTFKALTLIESADGHLNKYGFTEFTLPADNNNIISSLTASTAVTNTTVHSGKATTTIEYKDTKGVTKSASIVVESSSLQVDDVTGGMSIDLVWGSF